MPIYILNNDNINLSIHSVIRVAITNLLYAKWGSMTMAVMNAATGGSNGNIHCHCHRFPLAALTELDWTYYIYVICESKSDYVNDVVSV